MQDPEGLTERQQPRRDLRIPGVSSTPIRRPISLTDPHSKSQRSTEFENRPSASKPVPVSFAELLHFPCKQCPTFSVKVDPIADECKENMETEQQTKFDGDVGSRPKSQKCRAPSIASRILSPREKIADPTTVGMAVGAIGAPRIHRREAASRSLTRH